MAGAPLVVFRTWIMMMVYVAAIERVPTEEQLDAQLGKAEHRQLKEYLRKTGTSESIVIQKVMEDVDHIKSRRKHDREYMSGYRCKTLRKDLHDAVLVGKIREEKIDKIDKSDKRTYTFDDFWKEYPKKVGMSMAIQTYLATVKTDKDHEDLMSALVNYKSSEEFKKGFIKNGSNWIEDWRGWVPVKKQIVKTPAPKPAVEPNPEERAKVAALIANTMKDLNAKNR
jgi:hypothetical protein